MACILPSYLWVTALADQEQAGVDYQGGGEEQAVQAVQHTAVAREEFRGVFDLDLTLEHGLKQVSQQSHHGQEQGQPDQARRAHRGQGPAAQGDAGDHRGGRASHHPGPGLPRTHLRIELGLAPGPAGVECPGISGHNHHHEPEDPPLPVAQVAQPDKVPQKQGDIEEAQDIDHQIPAQVGNMAVGDEVEEEKDKENPHQHEEGAAWVTKGGDPLGGAETQEEHRSQDNGF